VIYRIRRYQAVPEQLDAFHAFFNEHLLPVQERHGARLVGRWVSDDHEVIAVWEYDSKDAYARIAAAVAADPDAQRAQQVRASHAAFFTAKHESLAYPTAVPTASR
jgi:hypothetical protein